MNSDPADQRSALSLVLNELRHSPAGSGGETVGLVVRALQLFHAEPNEVLAFVEGRHVRSVQREWGDNSRSYWAYFYHVPSSSSDSDVLLTLEADGGVADFLGIF